MGEDVQPREPERPREPSQDLGVHATPSQRQKLVCPFCHDLLGASGNVSCPSETCGATYHKLCWKECVDHYHGCAVYGCKGGKGGEAAALAGERLPLASERPRRPSPLARVLILVLLSNVAGGVAFSLQKFRSPPPPVTAGPHDARWWMDVASTRFNAYHHKEAADAASEALRLLEGGFAKPTNAAGDVNQRAWAYSLRGLANAWEKDFAHAFPDLDRAIELVPGEPAYFHNRAVADELVGDHAACIRDCEKVLELAPGYSQAALIRSKIAEHKAAMGRTPDSTTHVGGG